MYGRLLSAFARATAGLASLARGVEAQSALSGEPIQITRSALGRITIDGDLSGEGWRKAARIDRWYETNPGDNVEPRVRTVGYLTYDDKCFYAGFEFEDPHVEAIRAPFVDRDNIGNGNHDYGGIIIDPRNTGRTATFFVAGRNSSASVGPCALDVKLHIMYKIALCSARRR